MEIIRFARNNIYRIGTNGTACAVSVPVGDTEMLELCHRKARTGRSHNYIRYETVFQWLRRLCQLQRLERVYIGVKGKSTCDCGRRV